MLLPLAIYAVDAISFTMSKAILSYLPPLLYVGSRILIAGGILLGYTVYKQGGLHMIHTLYANITSFLKLMLVQTYIPYTLSFTALQQVTSVEASLIYNISPCITAIFSYALFRKRLSWIKILGLTISMGALIPLFYHRIIGSYGEAFKSVDALMLLVISVTSTTYGWLLFSTFRARLHHDATLVSSISLIGGGISILVTSSIAESWNIAVGSAIDKVVGLFCALLIAIDIIFTNMYGYLLSYYTATFMALTGITLPLFTSLFSWAFLEENIPNGFAMSCVMMAIGLYAFYHGEHQEVEDEKTVS